MQQTPIDAEYVAVVVLEEHLGMTARDDLQFSLLGHLLVVLRV